MSLAIEECHKVAKVISANTVVSVLLYGMYIKKNWTETEVYMENFEKNLINICRKGEKNREIVPYLISLHALIGCDTVPML